MSIRKRLCIGAAFALLFCCLPELSAQEAASTFPALEQWKSAVLAGDKEGLRKLFSTQPAPEITTVKGASDIDSEVSFWAGLKAQRINLEVVKQSSPQPGVQAVVFQAELQPAAAKSPALYVTQAQVWQQQADQWRLVVVKRTDAAHLKQPLDTNKNIYPPGIDAHAEIKEAEEKAEKEHKRVLLVFGANWCFDCHVLDLAFQRSDFAPIVARYAIVHIDIGEDGKKNGDIAREFHIPLEKGIPALAVLDGAGKLLVSQKNGEFENARAMTPEAILEFLNKWKPEA
jgi:thioredoxin 1